MRLFILLFLLLTLTPLTAQTVVKMDMPQQADKPLTVVALFNEEIPEEIPVVLGVMGYNLEGGTTPYLFEWTLNNLIISTSDVAIFTPKKGDNLSLTIIDNNNCRASTSFNLKVAKLEQNNTKANDEIKIYPTIIKDNLIIKLPTTAYATTLVRIFDVDGMVRFEKSISETTTLNLNLSPGTYFVSVKHNSIHKVEKIIAQ